MDKLYIKESGGYWLIVAVEKNDRERDCIRARFAQSEAINSAIRDCIVRHSTILRPVWNVPRDPDFTVSNINYNPPSCKKLLGKLAKLVDPSDIQASQDWIDCYCRDYNAPKIPMAFEDLVNSAIHLPPMPHVGKALN